MWRTVLRSQNFTGDVANCIAICQNFAGDVANCIAISVRILLAMWRTELRSLSECYWRCSELYCDLCQNVTGDVANCIVLKTHKELNRPKEDKIIDNLLK